MVEQEQRECNHVFFQVAELLKKYLVEEGNGKYFNKLESIERAIDQNTFVISFNYTETIKAYTNRYEYIHGSIVNDNHIILGCAKGELPDAATGIYSNYLKSRQIEELNFRRYLDENNIPNKAKLLKEIQPRIDSLYSGRGTYNFPVRKIPRIIKMLQTSRVIIRYAKLNNYEAIKKEYGLSHVEEIIIAGHSLETDLIYITGVVSNACNPKIVRLFTYEDEDKNDINRKVDIINSLVDDSRIKIILEKY